MKLAVSNIAWAPARDREVFDSLQRLGVHALEVAPTRLWPDWQGATPAAARPFRRTLTDAGFQVPSLQAILFAKPDCKLFGTETERVNLVNHLRLCADLAVQIGAVSLVFGAPKNRARGELSPSDAFSSAAELFREVSRYYASQNVCLCLEANPPQYGCTFITNSQEAA
ncbi:MAG TPA: TIM barrel protein, partial [Bryobacteraceae bacterium]|nr:TIM barrel protein [Bryobacteraceae bacterium]